MADCSVIGSVSPQRSTADWLHPAGDHLSNIIGQKNTSDIKTHLEPLIKDYPDIRCVWVVVCVWSVCVCVCMCVCVYVCVICMPLHCVCVPSEDLCWFGSFMDLRF